MLYTKLILRGVSVIALCGLIFSSESCTKDNRIEEIDLEKKTMFFTAEFSSAVSKSTIDGLRGVAKWEVGDTLAIFEYAPENETQFDLMKVVLSDTNITNNGTIAKFSVKDLDTSKSYAAVFPYSAVCDPSTGKGLYLINKADTGFCMYNSYPRTNKSAHTAVALASDTGKLSFKNINQIIKFNTVLYSADSVTMYFSYPKTSQIKFSDGSNMGPKEKQDSIVYTTAKLDTTGSCLFSVPAGYTSPLYFCVKGSVKGKNRGYFALSLYDSQFKSQKNQYLEITDKDVDIFYPNAELPGLFYNDKYDEYYQFSQGNSFLEGSSYYFEGSQYNSFIPSTNHINVFTYDDIFGIYWEDSQLDFSQYVEDVIRKRKKDDEIIPYFLMEASKSIPYDDEMDPSLLRAGGNDLRLGSVNGVKGIILEPQGFKNPIKSIIDNNYSASEWDNYMEPAGLVFLPLINDYYVDTGKRVKSSDKYAYFYWTQNRDTLSKTLCPYGLGVIGEELKFKQILRDVLRSVRLVKRSESLEKYNTPEELLF